MERRGQDAENLRSPSVALRRGVVCSFAYGTLNRQGFSVESEYADDYDNSGVSESIR